MSWETVIALGMDSEQVTIMTKAAGDCEDLLPRFTEAKGFHA